MFIFRTAFWLTLLVVILGASDNTQAHRQDRTSVAGPTAVPAPPSASQRYN